MTTFSELGEPSLTNLYEAINLNDECGESVTLQTLG